MDQNMKKMQCGNCGESSVEIYSDGEYKTIIECCNCKNTTELKIDRPQISFEWHGNSSGVHCIF